MPRVRCEQSEDKHLASFVFPLNRANYSFDLFLPEILAQKTRLSLEAFDIIARELNGKLESVQRLGEKVDFYSRAAIYTCICLVGLIVFAPLVIYYTRKLNAEVQTAAHHLRSALEKHSEQLNIDGMTWSVERKVYPRGSLFAPWYVNREVAPTTQHLDLFIVVRFREQQ